MTDTIEQELITIIVVKLVLRRAVMMQIWMRTSEIATLASLDMGMLKVIS